uniref:Gustatory receptor n=1 Tax=Tetranychus urticae TaxID=32264 RepID=A0A158P5J9_TETUR
MLPFSVQNIVNIKKPIQPSSILSQSILRKSKSARIVHLAVSLGFVLRSFTVYYDLTSEDGISKASSNNISKYYAIWLLIYSFVFPCSLIALIFNSTHYFEFLNIWKNIVKRNENVINAYITTKRKFSYRIILLAFIYETALNFIQVIQLVDLLTRNNFSLYFQVIRIGSQVLVLISIAFGWSLFMYFILETCIYMHSAFVLIDYHLDNNKLNQLDSNDIEQIILARNTYSESIKLISCADNLLSFLITGFYIFFVGYCFAIIGQFSMSDGTFIDVLTVIFRLFGETIYIGSMTHYLVNINKLSDKIFEKVYSLTLNRSRTVEYNDEINLFLLRVGRNDVGFRFANLFVMTPAFVSSLATISLTLVLTLPSLLH